MKFFSRRCFKDFLLKIKRGAAEEISRLNPIDVRLKIASIILACVLSAYVEPGINYFLKVIICLVFVNLVFIFGYYVIGVIAKPLPFLNNKILAVHGSIFLIYYVGIEEVSYKFLNETWIWVASVLVISYLALSLREKYDSSFIKNVCIVIAVGAVGAITTDKLILGEYRLQDGLREEVRGIYESFNIEAGDEKYLMEYDEDLESDNEIYDVVWYGNSEDPRDSYSEARLTTEPVTIGTFIEEPDGIDKVWRTVYWDTDFQEVNMNGHLFIPKYQNDCPLVAVVHGNHSMEESSEMGYEYIGNYLAQNGYVVAMLDENFFNGSWSGGYDDENDGRTYLTLKHLEQILEWNQEEGNPLFGKIDKNNIGLLGHSRGGETVFLSKLFTELDDEPEDYGVDFNFDFDIKSIATIGTTYGQYDSCGDYPAIEDVNYLAIQGSNDSDVSEFQGKKAYDNVRFSGEEFFFKSYVYIEGANHGQFNTRWGRNDNDFPVSLLINKKEIMNGEKQRQLALKYVGAFFESTLKGKEGQREIFKDNLNGLSKDDDRRYINSYSDSTFVPLENFDGRSGYKIQVFDPVTRSQLFGGDIKKKRIELRDESKLNNYGLEIVVPPESKREVRIIFDRPIRKDEFMEMIIDISSFSNENLIYTLEAGAICDEDDEIRNISAHRPLWNNIRSNLMKTHELNEKHGDKEDNIFQTIFIPYEETHGDEIRGIKFIFDEGRYIIDNIGVIKKE